VDAKIYDLSGTPVPPAGGPLRHHAARRNTCPGERAKSAEPAPVLSLDSRFGRHRQKQITGLKTRRFIETNQQVSAGAPDLRFGPRRVRPQNARGRSREIRPDSPRETAIILLRVSLPAGPKTASPCAAPSQITPTLGYMNAKAFVKFTPSFGVTGPKTVKTRFCAPHDELRPEPAAFETSIGFR